MSSSFQILPPNLDQQVASIKNSIFVHQNGIIAKSIADKGVLYKKSFGVPIPELKHFANSLPHEAPLAQRLWDESIRETMLLAFMLYPPCEMSATKTMAWMSQIQNIELAEQGARLLFSQSPEVERIIFDNLHSSNHWDVTISILTAAYALNRLAADIIALVDGQTWELLDNDKYEIYWAVTVYLKKRGLQSKETAKMILSKIKPLQQSEKIHQRYIFEEVSTDLQYRYNI
ncbi:MAG: DNA alkylation repair protein [Microbacter sp.]